MFPGWRMSGMGHPTLNRPQAPGESWAGAIGSISIDTFWPVRPKVEHASPLQEFGAENQETGAEISRLQFPVPGQCPVKSRKSNTVSAREAMGGNGAALPKPADRGTRKQSTLWMESTWFRAMLAKKISFQTVTSLVLRFVLASLGSHQNCPDQGERECPNNQVCGNQDHCYCHAYSLQ